MLVLIICQSIDLIIRSDQSIFQYFLSRHFSARQLEQLEYRMVRDIGQILALLQQQAPVRLSGNVEWSPETPVGPQQQSTTLEVERHKSNFMDARSSCSLPTVAESRAESRVDSRHTQGLATQRSLDSASR